eukprot:GILJ01007201.1.p1 GENE.GILJ01007201.1~~GILJ01007201.1.p1  ORF type:complete len:2032 (-),score=390.63 GILJ01007201.1:103-5400(-)
MPELQALYLQLTDKNPYSRADIEEIKHVLCRVDFKTLESCVKRCFHFNGQTEVQQELEQLIPEDFGKIDRLIQLFKDCLFDTHAVHPRSMFVTLQYLVSHRKLNLKKIIGPRVKDILHQVTTESPQMFTWLFDSLKTLKMDVDMTVELPAIMRTALTRFANIELADFLSAKFSDNQVTPDSLFIAEPLDFLGDVLKRSSGVQTLKLVLFYQNSPISSEVLRESVRQLNYEQVEHIFHEVAKTDNAEAKKLLETLKDLGMYFPSQDWTWLAEVLADHSAGALDGFTWLVDYLRDHMNTSIRMTTLKAEDQLLEYVCCQLADVQGARRVKFLDWCITNGYRVKKIFGSTRESRSAISLMIAKACQEVVQLATWFCQHYDEPRELFHRLASYFVNNTPRFNIVHQPFMSILFGRCQAALKTVASKHHNGHNGSKSGHNQAKQKKKEKVADHAKPKSVSFESIAQVCEIYCRVSSDLSKAESCQKRAFEAVDDLMKNYNVTKEMLYEPLLLPVGSNHSLSQCGRMNLLETFVIRFMSRFKVKSHKFETLNRLDMIYNLLDKYPPVCVTDGRILNSIFTSSFFYSLETWDVNKQDCLLNVLVALNSGDAATKKSLNRLVNKILELTQGQITCRTADVAAEKTLPVHSNPFETAFYNGNHELASRLLQADWSWKPTNEIHLCRAVEMLLKKSKDLTPELTRFYFSTMLVGRNLKALEILDAASILKLNEELIWLLVLKGYAPKVKSAAKSFPDSPALQKRFDLYLQTFVKPSRLNIWVTTKPENVKKELGLDETADPSLPLNINGLCPLPKPKSMTGRTLLQIAIDHKLFDLAIRLIQHPSVDLSVESTTDMTAFSIMFDKIQSELKSASSLENMKLICAPWLPILLISLEHIREPDAKSMTPVQNRFWKRFSDEYLSHYIQVFLIADAWEGIKLIKEKRTEWYETHKDQLTWKWELPRSDPLKSTLLHHAAKWGAFQCTSRLVSEELYDVGVLDDEKRSPKELALLSGATNCHQFLLEKEKQKTIFANRYDIKKQIWSRSKENLILIANDMNAPDKVAIKLFSDQSSYKVERDALAKLKSHNRFIADMMESVDEFDYKSCAIDAVKRGRFSCYLVLYAGEISLEEHIRNDMNPDMIRALSGAEIDFISNSVSGILAHLGAHNRIHGDLCPRNLLRFYDGVYRLIDLDACVEIDPSKKINPIWGFPETRYTPPELAKAMLGKAREKLLEDLRKKEAKQRIIDEAELSDEPDTQPAFGRRPSNQVTLEHGNELTAEQLYQINQLVDLKPEDITFGPSLTFDVWSFGCILYELLTEQSLIQVEDTGNNRAAGKWAVLKAIAELQDETVEKRIKENVPREEDAQFLRKLLKIQPKQRCRSRDLENEKKNVGNTAILNNMSNVLQTINASQSVILESQKAIASELSKVHDKLERSWTTLKAIATKETDFPSLFVIMPKAGGKGLAKLRDPSSWFKNQFVLHLLCEYDCDGCLPHFVEGDEGIALSDVKGFVKKATPYLKTAMRLVRLAAFASKFIGCPFTIPEEVNDMFSKVSATRDFFNTALEQAYDICEIEDPMKGALESDSELTSSIKLEEKERQKVRGGAKKALEELVTSKTTASKRYGQLELATDESTGRVMWVCAHHYSALKEKALGSQPIQVTASSVTPANLIQPLPSKGIETVSSLTVVASESITSTASVVSKSMTIEVSDVSAELVPVITPPSNLEYSVREMQSKLDEMHRWFSANVSPTAGATSKKSKRGKGGQAGNGKDGCKVM